MLRNGYRFGAAFLGLFGHFNDFLIGARLGYKDGDILFVQGGRPHDLHVCIGQAIHIRHDVQKLEHALHGRNMGAAQPKEAKRHEGRKIWETACQKDFASDSALEHYLPVVRRIADNEDIRLF